MRYLTAAEYQQRVGTLQVPMQRDGTVDTARIEDALDDASATCRTYLPDDLLDSTGAPRAIEDVADRVADALPGIVCALAQASLADGATGSEEVVLARRRGAVKQLEMMQRKPDRVAVTAAIVEGASQWIPGEAAAETGGDG